MIIWCMVSEIWSATDKIFLSFWVFFALNNPKNLNKKRINEDITILQMHTKNYDHMMYSSWDMVHNTQIARQMDWKSDMRWVPNLKYAELWCKMRDLISPITKNSDDYDDKYMKNKFNLDDELPLNNNRICSTVIFVRAVFHDNNKYYPQVSLDDCSHKLWKI